MRFFALILLLTVFAGFSLDRAALAQSNGDLPQEQKLQAEPPVAKLEKKPVILTDDLDEMFHLLKRTRDPKLSARISAKIWELWQTSDSRSVDLLMTWARAAMQRRQFAAALDLLDQVVVIRPDYAEGWNQRATLHFVMKKYGKSVSDIERTLALEPRHYGALAGLAAIQQTLGQDKAALAAWYKALEVYPAMKSAQKSVIELEEELAGSSL